MAPRGSCTVPRRPPGRCARGLFIQAQTVNCLHKLDPNLDCGPRETRCQSWVCHLVATCGLRCLVILECVSSFLRRPCSARWLEGLVETRGRPLHFENGRIVDLRVAHSCFVAGLHSRIPNGRRFCEGQGLAIASIARMASGGTHSTTPHACRVRQGIAWGTSRAATLSTISIWWPICCSAPRTLWKTMLVSGAMTCPGPR